MSEEEILEELRSLSPSEYAIMNMIDLFNSKKRVIEKLQKENEELKEKLDFEERSETFYQKKYFELKKENEELKLRLEERRKYTSELQKELYEKTYRELLNDNYVHKDKIRNKMKEIEFYINNVDNNEGQAIYKVLEEILEE